MDKPNRPSCPLAARTGSPASTADSSTWGTFERVADFRGADGIGFVFTEDDPYVGIDLDDCRDPDTGELTDLANSIVEQLDSYTEISPSGTGIHIIVRGVLPAWPSAQRRGRDVRGRPVLHNDWERPRRGLSSDPRVLS